jgi:hypothetical protein
MHILSGSSQFLLSLPSQVTELRSHHNRDFTNRNQNFIFSLIVYFPDYSGHKLSWVINSTHSALRREHLRVFNFLSARSSEVQLSISSSRTLRLLQLKALKPHTEFFERQLGLFISLSQRIFTDFHWRHIFANAR